MKGPTGERAGSTKIARTRAPGGDIDLVDLIAGRSVGMRKPV